MMCEINIGIMANAATREIMKGVLHEFPNLNGIYYDENFKEGLEDIIRDSKVEALVVGDAFTYDRIVSNFFLEIPVHLIPVGAYAYYEALLNIYDHLPYRNLSIDSCNPNTQKALIGYKISQRFTLDFIPLTMDEGSKLVDFHVNKFNNNNSLVLTASLKVQQEMVKRLIPCELIIPSHNDIVSCLERALLSTASRLKNENQFAMCTIFLKDESKLDSITLFKKNLRSLRKSLQGRLYKVDNFYEIITNRGVIEHYSHGYKSFPFLEYCESLAGGNVYIGIGFSNTIEKAQKHSMIALNQSRGKAMSCCYIVREDNTAFGPITPYSDPSEKYATAITDPTLLDKAQLVGISASYMDKLIDKLSKSETNFFSAQELALLLEISLRSANRIILRATDAGVMEVVGEEKISTKGRPRRLYKLTK